MVFMEAFDLIWTFSAVAAPAQRSEPERRQVRKVQLNAKKKKQKKDNISSTCRWASTLEAEKCQIMAIRISARKIKVVSGNDPKRLDASDGGTNHAHSHTRTGSTEGENATNVFGLTSPSSVSPSGSAEERKKERSRSGLAVRISVVSHSGEEADVERASVGVRERDGEGVRQKARERKEIDTEREGGAAARVRRSSPGIRSVEFPAHPLRPAPSPPDRRQDSR